MATIDTLPPDQRAVLQLVLQRGRSYDDIAGLLSIDRAAVRDRALGALDALGPSTRVAPERRALITDYLLGQLPAKVRDLTREHLASSASERAWARVVAGELAPLAGKPLPEIPASQAILEPARDAAPAPRQPEPAATSAATAAGTQELASAIGHPRPGPVREPEPGRPDHPASRRGGSILLAVGALIAVVVIIVVLATSGGSSPKPATTSTPTTTPATTPATTSTPTTTSPSKSLHIIGQLNLRPPSARSKAVGIADIVTEGKLTAVIVAAEHIPANTTHDAYAIWLYSPGGVAKLLGYVSPAVGKSGLLKTSGPLPANFTTYKELLVTRETTTNNTTPGPTVLEGIMSVAGG